MNVPSNLSYTKDHEWLKSESPDIAQIGITDYAQNSLGDITFVELPKAGQSFSAGDTFGVVESVKAASDLYMPVDGEVIEINPVLEASPELVNRVPYGDGWMLRIKISNPDQLKKLLSPEEYEKIGS